jgi:CTP synthase (UTP-ammonia lyase)
MADASHAEIDDGGTAVIVPLACSLRGQTRLVQVVPGTKAHQICGPEPMIGYHFCGYGADPDTLSVLQAKGLVVSGYADDGTVEIIELPDHPFFMATLFQPQVASNGSGADDPLHPLLIAFAAAVSAHRVARPEPVSDR